LKSEGAIVETVSMHSFEAAIATYYIIAPAEASSNLARFDGVRYSYRDQEAETLSEMFKRSRGKGFGPEVKRRIILGTYVLSSGYYDAYYLKAQKVRTLIKEDFNRIFSDFDVILSPTAPTPAFKFGEHSQNPLNMYVADIATIPANMAGLPSLSIPCGFSSQGLPIGMQLTAKAFDESTLFKIGHLFQVKTHYHTCYPEGILHGV
jgi:aspartyl-tRNA(Asn)/glutamyl-tRNA(Gln) amidotransferase subunit A